MDTRSQNILRDVLLQISAQRSIHRGKSIKPMNCGVYIRNTLPVTACRQFHGCWTQALLHKQPAMTDQPGRSMLHQSVLPHTDIVLWNYVIFIKRRYFTLRTHYLLVNSIRSIQSWWWCWHGHQLFNYFTTHPQVKWTFLVSNFQPTKQILTFCTHQLKLTNKVTN